MFQRFSFQNNLETGQIIWNEYKNAHAHMNMHITRMWSVLRVSLIAILILNISEYFVSSFLYIMHSIYVCVA